jgi:hypothetical protein
MAEEEDATGYDIKLSVRVKWAAEENPRGDPKDVSERVPVNRSLTLNALENLIGFLYGSPPDAYEFAKWAAVME